MTVTKLDGCVVRIPGGGVFPPTDVFVNWRIVESSNIERVGWDDAGNMYVRFKRGATYAYLSVSRQQAVAVAYAATLTNAKSVGTYFNTRVKKRYASVQIA